MDPKLVFQPYPKTKKKPIRATKSQKDPKVKSKLKVRIEENIENETCSLVDPETGFEPYPNPKIAH